MATVKLEPNDDDVFVMSNYEDDVCEVVDLSNTSPFPFKNIDSTPSQTLVNLFQSYEHEANSLGHTIPMSSTTPSSFLHQLYYGECIDTNKVHKKSKSNLVSIDFNTIDVQVVIYLFSSFDRNVLFVLPLCQLEFQLHTTI